MVYLMVGSFSGIYLLYFITSQVYKKNCEQHCNNAFLDVKTKFSLGQQLNS